MQIANKITCLMQKATSFLVMNKLRSSIYHASARKEAPNSGI